jgi:hypothetical protein
MPAPDFTEEERAEIVQAIRAAIDGDRYVLSPRVKRLKSALAKLDPASAERSVAQFPPPKPAAGRCTNSAGTDLLRRKNENGRLFRDDRK